MNIVHVYNRKWPTKRPGVSFGTLTCDGLSKSGANVDMITSQVPEDQYKDKSISYILKDYFSINSNARLNVFPLKYKKYIGENTMFYLTAFKKIIELSKEKKIDIIMTMNTNFLPYLYLLKKIVKAKVFFETHHLYVAPNLREKNNRKKETLIQKYFLPKIDGIICLQKEQIKLYKDNISQLNYCLARTGVKNIYKEHKAWENKYIGYVGSLDKSKGVKEILKAFKLVKTKDLKLLLVGGRNEEIIKEYTSLAEELGISDRFKITGWVSRKKLEDYLRKIKIGIVPAQDTFYNRYITSPMKIFNYFSYGIPIVGSALPTIEEIVTNNGGLFYKKGAQEKLAATIDLLASDKDLYDKKSKYIFERASKLTWEKRGEKLINFFENAN